jgi:hypothetical protein
MGLRKILWAEIQKAENGKAEMIRYRDDNGDGSVTSNGRSIFLVSLATSRGCGVIS